MFRESPNRITPKHQVSGKRKRFHKEYIYSVQRVIKEWSEFHQKWFTTKMHVSHSVNEEQYHFHSDTKLAKVDVWSFKFHGYCTYDD